VDDGVFHWRDHRHIFAPIVMPTMIKAAAMGASFLVEAVEVMVVDAPARSIGDGGATRIEEDERGIEAMGGAHRSVDAPAVAANLGRFTDVNVPKVAGAMLARVERNLGEDVVAVDRLKDEVHGDSVSAHQD